MEETFGRYRLLDRLGEGGMAEVFKAKSFGVEGFEKVLVIKRILPKLAKHTKFVEMFVHEAKLAVRLSHANIVQVFDLGRIDHVAHETPTSYFIAMEYVPGLDLSSALKRCRKQKIPVPLSMAVFVTAEVAKALDHAHRRRNEQNKPLGIVHRDISPQNILLSWEGEVKVTDFGIAKAKDSFNDAGEDEDTRAGRVKGKLSYMSPEQSRAQSLDGRSDLYSLGIVFYEMVTGTNPFSAPTTYETLRRLQSAEYPPIDLLRPEVPKPLADIVDQLLAKDAGQRVPDAGRLHEQLLGYFYSSGERFGARDLADFLEQFREEAPKGEVEGAVFDEQTGANDRTPVEVPNPAGKERKTSTSGLFALGERPDTGSKTGGTGSGTGRTAELMGERREVTALVLSFGRGTCPPGVADRAHVVLERYGAKIVEEDPAQLVAIFGLGDADARDTESAVRAGLIALRGAGAPHLSAGVHVARILVDPGGEPIRDERFTSLVATTQSFARAAEGRVAVSPLAARIIRSVFGTEELPGAGRSAPEGGRLVTSPRPASAVYGRFVGRQQELRSLGEWLASASRRHPQLVVVHGDKGVGKTRLLEEMLRRLGKGNYNVGFYRAACPRNGSDVPLSGVTSLLSVLCGVIEGDESDRMAELLLPRLRALGLRDDECHSVLAQLGMASRKSSQPPGVSPAGVSVVFGKMVQSLCDDRLHCFAWDDAQNMDEATIEVIRNLLPPTEQLGPRAMFILASRDPIEALSEYPHLELGELSDEDSARLISLRVGARILPPELLSFCRERAGGHPLFLEELVRELMDSAAISVMNGAVKARLDGATAVPRTLRTLIASRVSRLDVPDRGLLQGAAILGNPFHTEVLAALLSRTVPQVDRAVAQLTSFLSRVGPAQAGFSSPMHLEIVLDAIPTEARSELHASAAQAYLSVAGDESNEFTSKIAHHLYQAGDPDRAASYYARAGLSYGRTYQSERSARHLLRALDLARLDDRKAAEISSWIEALSDAVGQTRSAPDLPDLTARALRRIDVDGTLELRVRSRLHVARSLMLANYFDHSLERLDDARELAGDDETLRREALSVEAEICSKSGDFTRGCAVADQLDKLGPVDNQRTLLAMAHVRSGAGDKRAALRVLDRADAIADPDDLVAASERQKQRVLVFIYDRDFERAVEASSKATEYARNANLRWDMIAALHNLGDASWRAGDLPRAYASLTESKDLAAACGIDRVVSLNSMHLAFLNGLRGDDKSLGILKDLTRQAEARKFVTDSLESRYLYAKLLVDRGRFEEATLELSQVREQAQSYGNSLIAYDAEQALAAVGREGGEDAKRADEAEPRADVEETVASSRSAADTDRRGGPSSKPTHAPASDPPPSMEDDPLARTEQRPSAEFLATLDGADAGERGDSVPPSKDSDGNGGS